MTYRVVVQHRAALDIRRSAAWWSENRSQYQAESWLNHAFRAFDVLEQFPRRHPKSPENDRFPFEIRDCRFGLGSRYCHRGIFTIDGDTVYVLAVRRFSQRPIERLEPPGSESDELPAD